MLMKQIQPLLGYRKARGTNFKYTAWLAAITVQAPEETKTSKSVF
jgi:hypothetical protein